jgi:hypothetical protein
MPLKLNMKNILTTISTLAFLLFSRPLNALAVNLKDFKILSTGSADKAGYNIYQGSLETVLSQAVTIILSLLGVIFIGFIIYGGVIWMTANGNEQKVEKAGDIIKESFIGLVVVLAAYAISFFLFNIFGGQLAGGQ